MLWRVDGEPVVLAYERIMRHASGGRNDETLACMLASWQAGRGMMPDCLGMAQTDFVALVEFHFPGLKLDSPGRTGREADQSRGDEYYDVLKLLMDNRACRCESENTMAMIVSQACQGQDHLWQDMGLWSRDQLSALMMLNFPSLAHRNTQNMKWKKFIYKQLCNAEGIYTCRAPSCEVCVDYDACFGPED